MREFNSIKEAYEELVLKKRRETNKRKTAAEMFERLGYARIEIPDIIVYENAENNTGMLFDADSKLFYYEENKRPVNIELRVLKAIAKQMEELGWLLDD